jgi:hypothetical protein
MTDLPLPIQFFISSQSAPKSTQYIFRANREPKSIDPNPGTEQNDTSTLSRIPSVTDQQRRALSTWEHPGSYGESPENQQHSATLRIDPRNCPKYVGSVRTPE